MQPKVARLWTVVAKFLFFLFASSTPSTEDKPMGLVVLIQATSVIGHRRRYGQPERTVLPTCEEERESLRSHDTLAAEFDRRIDELDMYFDQVRGHFVESFLSLLT